MRQLSWVGLGACVRSFDGGSDDVSARARRVALAMLACAGLGCGSAAPVVTTPVPEAEEPGSLLVAEPLPAPIAREHGPAAVGTPLFQVGHQESIQAMDISPDGRLALVAGFDGTVSVLDFETGVTR
ncbi:MAG: hypothetical protein KC593_24005, partial [Myxococcales bacterium]|nr:hypothetical protein [Myxococcales bacterium]